MKRGFRTMGKGAAMAGRMIGALVLGLGGAAILLSLGFWQLSRLDEKLAIIAEIEARVVAAPVALPAAPVETRDRYLPVRVSGRYTGEAVHVLGSRRGLGTGIQVIAVLETTDGRRVLADRGFLPDAARNADLRAEGVDLTGNLHWPRDADRFTPAPDLGRGLWFSRMVAPIAAHLDTEPVLIVARQDAPVPGLIPSPIASVDIRNDHLNYAITWFLLATVWLGMTAYLVWRIRRNVG